VTVRYNSSIIGLGLSAQGRVPGRSSIDLRVDALRAAFTDCGLAPHAIGGFIYQPGMVEMAGYCVAGDVPKLLGFAPNFLWEIQSGGTSAIAAISAASGAIDQGLCDYVAISYGDTALSGELNVGASGFLNTAADTPGAYGMYSAAADHALAARRYMHDYSISREQLGAVALAARTYAGLRPDAYLHDRPLSMADYLGGRMIAEPLSKYDCCLVADGACALIVTSADRAKDARRSPVTVRGMGFGHSLQQSFHGASYHESGRNACCTALRNADVALADIDVAQLYDCFTITVLMTLEACGFCAPGEAASFVAEGNLLPGGAIPTNTGGGELAWGYLQGFTPLLEGVRQLRGDGGASQINGARLCLVNGHGGTSKDVGYMEYADACLVLEAA
jgi:acetyl-CoA acetyltransferase